MESTMDSLTLKNRVEDGVAQMRKLYQEFQDKQKGSDAVREFLRKAFKDDALLRRYLIGGKYRSTHAFDTLRSYAEVRFNKYPEMFPATLPPKEYLLRDNQPIFGVLKGLKPYKITCGTRRTAGWDPDKCSIQELNILTLSVFERVLLDEDGLNNGLIFVQDNSGMGMAQAKHYTLGTMLRILNIYWYSFPLKVKGVYFVNVPSVLTYVYDLKKPFMPKKLQERFLLTTTSRGFKDLHQHVSPDFLPKALGGNLEAREAIDSEFMEL
ncbi:Alpha-tocopherol transfer protein-like [Orchesella cincta]|uniref:Alpha-tocopherol transfer protein-like n=1 Tax=Orchesella cincta TaxID=48709 RepID=A0A1D2M6G2_ORCCI|nr:Alpha-tocopherol transfer protein-like [Orchesella cincta]